jgi:hypothetical protein
MLTGIPHMIISFEPMPGDSGRLRDLRQAAPPVWWQVKPAPALRAQKKLTASSLERSFPWFSGTRGRPRRSRCPRGDRWRAQRRDQPQDVGEQMARDGNLGHLEGDVRPCLTTFAPILMSFSRRLVSDQSWIGSGVASVRRKFPRL